MRTPAHCTLGLRRCFCNATITWTAGTGGEKLLAQLSLQQTCPVGHSVSVPSVYLQTCTCTRGLHQPRDVGCRFKVGGHEARSYSACQHTFVKVMPEAHSRRQLAAHQASGGHRAFGSVS